MALSGIYNKRKKDGTWATYSAAGAGSKHSTGYGKKRSVTAKQKAAVSKLTKAGKTHKGYAAGEWDLMEVRQKRTKLNTECGARRKALEAELKAIYARYPKLKPKTAKPPRKTVGTVGCSSPKFAKCEATVYTYANGNQRIITTQKLKTPKKSTNKKGRKSLSPSKKGKRLSDSTCSYCMG